VSISSNFLFNAVLCRQAFNYVEKFGASVPTLPAAVTLCRLLSCLASKTDLDELQHRTSVYICLSLPPFLSLLGKLEVRRNVYVKSISPKKYNVVKKLRMVLQRTWTFFAICIFSLFRTSVINADKTDYDFNMRGVYDLQKFLR